jgi:hypothetical protein
MRTSFLIFSGRFFIVQFNSFDVPIRAMEVLFNGDRADDILISSWSSCSRLPLVSYGIAQGFLPLSQLLKLCQKR